MRKKKGYIHWLICGVFATISFFPSYGQSWLNADIGFGYAFNHNSFKLGVENASDVRAKVLQVGAVFSWPLYQKFHMETGLSGKFLFASGSVGISNYTSQSLKFYIPLRVSYYAREDFEIMAGMAMKNNKNLKLFHIAGSYNFRYDATLRSTYQIHHNLRLTATVNRNIGLPKAYFVHDPRTSLLLGLIYSFGSRKTSDQSTPKI